MKKFTSSTVLAAAVMFLLSSCSTEKRFTFRGGPSNSQMQHQTVSQQPVQTPEIQVSSTTKPELVVASATGMVNEPNTSNSKTLASYKVPKKVRSMITKQVSSSLTSNTVALNKVNQNVTNTNEQLGKSSARPSQLIALILAIFLGTLGVHRFYLGYTGIGLLMLFTGGVLGILWIIDIIRIAIGDLQPKDGSYDQ